MFTSPTKFNLFFSGRSARTANEWTPTPTRIPTD